MWRRVAALCVIVAMPGAASAGPIKEAVEKAGKEISLSQREVEARNRTRLWTGVGLIAAGAALATLGSVELGDDEEGPDDGEDFDNSDDGEDSDGWGNKALIGGGIAAAALGGVVLLTGRTKQGPAVSIKHGRVTIHHTIRF